MKAYGAYIALVLTAGILGCGDDRRATSAERTTSETKQGRTESAQPSPLAKPQPLPQIPPKRDPLEKLIIKNLKLGEGPTARWGDMVFPRYVGVWWKTGEVFVRDSRVHPHGFELDPNGVAPGWQKGLLGMRVGGMRELRVPSDLLYGDGDAAYVVTLVEVEPGAASR